MLVFLVETAIIFSVVIIGIRIRFHARHDDILFVQRGVYKIALTTLVSQFIFYLFSLYDISKPRLRRELLTDLFQAVGTVIVIFGLIFTLRPTLLLGYLDPLEDRGMTRYGSGVTLLSMLLALTLMICWRLMIHWVMRHPRLGERLLIVGTDKLARDVAQEAMLRLDLGYKVIGFVTASPDRLTNRLLKPPVLGNVSDLLKMVDLHSIDRVVVALEDRRGHLPVDQLLKIRREGRAVIEEGTSLYEKLTGKISVQMLRPSWLIFSGGGKRTTFWNSLRRIFNIILALSGLVLAFPIMILAALAIRLDSRGPIFYVQERVGRHGRLFHIIKFRSMRVDAEVDGLPQWAQTDDPRVTRVGRFMRKTRIDEIPQFINVLRGEMSFVGPRAERPYFVGQLSEQIPYYEQRHLVEPGLTGWAQVNYGYGSSVEDAVQKLQYDLYYIKNVSLLFDLWIILKSIRIVLFGYGR
jgi:sugar transferase (PEP-CTERM system associated)